MRTAFTFIIFLFVTLVSLGQLPKNFKSLDIIDKEKLLSDNVIPKRYVVVITAKRPKGLVKTETSK